MNITATCPKIASRKSQFFKTLLFKIKANRHENTWKVKRDGSSIEFDIHP